MKEPHGEGIAIRSDPESCVNVRKDGGEALTGAQAGWVPSRENDLTPGCRRPYGRRKAILAASPSRDTAGPRAVSDPMHAWKHFEREPGDPASVCREVADRIGKSQDTRR
jgi:hypothetical protein